MRLAHGTHPREMYRGLSLGQRRFGCWVDLLVRLCMPGPCAKRLFSIVPCLLHPNSHSRSLRGQPPICYDGATPKTTMHNNKHAVPIVRGQPPTLVIRATLRPPSAKIEIGLVANPWAKFQKIKTVSHSAPLYVKLCSCCKRPKSKRYCDWARQAQAIDLCLRAEPTGDTMLHAGLQPIAPIVPH